LLPQTLKPGYGPGSAKIVSAIKVAYFILKAIRPPDVAKRRKRFFI